MRKIKALVLIGLLIGLMQVIKLIVMSLGIRYRINKGIAFSLFNDDGFLGILLNITGLLTLLFYYFRNFKKLKIYSYEIIFLVSGGFSNLLDRIIHGGVVDYISIMLLPMFNLADIFVVGSLIVLLIRSIFRNDNQKIQS